MKKIYIFCPAYVKTGGPELLHQLSDFLITKHQEIDTYFVYYNKNENRNYTNEDFKKYRIHVTDYPVDEEESLIIVPETRILELNKFNKAKKAIWWQSVDNYQLIYEIGYRFKSNSNKFKAIASCIYHKDYLNKIFSYHASKHAVNTANIHLCQSYYSKQYLIKRGIKDSKVLMLSDYINDNYLSVNYKVNLKEDLVAYFPKKGFDVTKRLISNGPNIRWVPIQNMTTTQVRDLLLKCKVYIDFGNFPGKDRVPREAAMCGCCVITGKKGASKYYEDVPINEKYKFDDPKSHINNILDTINYCLNNYEKCEKDFAYFRNTILKEKAVFIDEIEVLVDYINSL